MADDENEIMSIDSVSNDGYTEEDFEQAANDKPLMTLFKRLIGNDSKENTVLTNAQIIDILKKEFDMDLSYIHDLEIEIYLNLMKKFLKDWPLWDEFDQSIQTLKSRNDTTSIKKKLEINHKNLKDYLSQMLEATKPYMKNVVESTKEQTFNKEKSIESTDSDDLILEVQCSRQQLNQLFFRRPHPDFNNTIFNVQIPNKITVNRFSLRAILNWPGIRIKVNLGVVGFHRETVHILKHKLVNKKLNYAREEPTQVNTSLQMKDLKPMTTCTLKDIRGIFSNNVAVDCYEQRVVEEVSYMLNQDFANAPDVNIYPMFRRNLNKYPYVRYLYTEVNTKQSCSSNSYDLQLEEMMTPMFNTSIFKFEKLSKRIANWLTIECVPCSVSFSASDGSGLWQHFDSEHQGEPDWLCTNCNESFKVNVLAETHWAHDCTK